MSDEYGDASDQVGDGGSRSPEPALADRLDSMERTLSTLGMRIDALVTSTTTYRSALNDRLNEYAELVSKLTRAQAEDLEALRESLLDVASGEVVGALWDEFRGARASIDEMRIAVERAEESARMATDVAARPAEPLEDPVERLEPLRADVSSLTAAVRDLLEQAEVVDETDERPDGMLTAVAADVASLRNELARGLVVEPSDALTDAVDQLRSDVAGLDTRLAAITDLQQAVAELRGAVADVAAPAAVTDPDPALARVDASVADLTRGLADVEARLDTLAGRLDALDALDGLEDRLGERLAALQGGDDGDDAAAEELRSVRDRVVTVAERLDSIAVLQEAVTSLRDEVRAAAASEPGPVAVPEELEGELATLRGGVEALDGELRAMRSGVEDIIARLDEGLVLADEIVPPTPAVPPEVDDQLAAIRDEVTTGFDSLRSLADRSATADTDLSPIAELLGQVRDDIAAVSGRLDAADRYATLDPDIVDLLREEIRGARSVPDDVLDQLRKELVALRRRIKLRAEGEIFTDEQLELIADAVARRLAQ